MDIQGDLLYIRMLGYLGGLFLYLFGDNSCVLAMAFGMEDWEETSVRFGCT